MSPASYLAAPPRVARASIASKLVVFVLLAAIVGAVAFVAAGVFAFVRAREFFRRFGAFGDAADDALAAVSAKGELLAVRSAGVGTGELEPALERLAVARARLAVLTAAVEDVRRAVRSVTGLRPTK